jgi:hypothetical protein
MRAHLAHCEVEAALHDRIAAARAIGVALHRRIGKSSQHIAELFDIWIQSTDFNPVAHPSFHMDDSVLAYALSRSRGLTLLPGDGSVVGLVSCCIFSPSLPLREASMDHLQLVPKLLNLIELVNSIRATRHRYHLFGALFHYLDRLVFGGAHAISAANVHTLPPIDVTMSVDNILNITRRSYRPAPPRGVRYKCPLCVGTFSHDAPQCTTCATHVCNQCHMVLAADHICEESERLSVQAVACSTTPCPSCAVPVFHGGGCAQVFCTNCKTFFNHGTGRLSLRSELLDSDHYSALPEAEREAVRAKLAPLSRLDDEVVMNLIKQFESTNRVNLHMAHWFRVKQMNLTSALARMPTAEMAGRAARVEYLEREPSAASRQKYLKSVRTSNSRRERSLASHAEVQRRVDAAAVVIFDCLEGRRPVEAVHADLWGKYSELTSRKRGRGRGGEAPRPVTPQV